MAVRPEEKKDTQPVTWEETRGIMEREMPHRTFRPVVGGSLALVAGYLNILQGILILAKVSFFPLLSNFISTIQMSTVGVNTLGIVMIVLGAVSVIGGGYAIARRGYPMALFGAITSLFPSLVIIPGILSLVFVGSGRSEFRKMGK
jgi:hypothetical protein